MSSYRRYYLPRVSWSDVKGVVWRIQPYNVTDYFFIFRVQNLLTSAPFIPKTHFSSRHAPTSFRFVFFRLLFFPKTHDMCFFCLLFLSYAHFSSHDQFSPHNLSISFRGGGFPLANFCSPTLSQQACAETRCALHILSLISGRQMHRINACIFLVAITKNHRIPYDTRWF